MGPKTDKCFLIAMPQLMDPNFFQTTTLLSDFSSDGAMGLVLNRPLNISLANILHKEANIEVDKPIPVYWGGPVQNDRGWIVHEDETLAKQSIVVEAGLYLSSSPEALKRMVEQFGEPHSVRYRFFLGYAGWGPKQLEQEISQSSWITAPLARDLLFDNAPQTLWKRSLATLGIDPVKLAAVPQSEAN